jgi:hypothetical protein
MDDPELTIALAEFMWAFEQVFHHDWRYARVMLHPANVGRMISDDGTFLEPHVDDEVDDWGYRAMLLERYRKLKALMQMRGIDSLPGSGDSTTG